MKEYSFFVMSELLNKGIFVGPFCEKNGLDVAALQSKDLKPLKREHLTVGLVLELWKKKRLCQTNAMVDQCIDSSGATTISEWSNI